MKRPCRLAAPLSLVAFVACAQAQCVCPADHDCNGFVNGDDFDGFVLSFEAGADSADFNGDSFVNGQDFDCFVRAFERGCCVYSADVTGDGQVRCDDLSTFVALYNTGDFRADANCDGVIDTIDYDVFTLLLTIARGDTDGSGSYACDDREAYLEDFDEGDIFADMDCDGDVDQTDLEIYEENFERVRDDFDGDSRISCRDFEAFTRLFEEGDPRADLDCDGVVTSLDFTEFIIRFEDTPVRLDMDGNRRINCDDMLAFLAAYECGSIFTDFDCDGVVEPSDLADYREALEEEVGMPCP